VLNGLMPTLYERSWPTPWKITAAALPHDRVAALHLGEAR
jgi:hypothetical protein